MASVVFAYRFDFYVSSSGGDPYPIARFDIDAQTIRILGPDSALGGTIKVVISAVEYEVVGYDFDVNTWYTLEVKIIDTSGTLTVYVKPTPLAVAGPYPPSSTEPASLYGRLGGLLFLEHHAPDLGAVTTAPLLLANADVAQADWVSGEGIVVFTDTFDNLPGPDSFIPPWDAQNIAGSGAPYPNSGHIPDPADSSRYVGCLSRTGNYIQVTLITENLPEAESATVAFHGGVAQ